MRRLVALALLLLAVPRGAVAQPPAPTPPEPPPPRVEASAQFTFLDTHGNATSQALGAGLDAVWRPDPWTYTAKAVFARTESDDSLTARSTTALLRAARALGGRLSGFGQYDYLRDEFAGVEHRHVIGAGLGYAAVDTRRQKLRLDAGVGYLTEQRPAPTADFDAATLTLGAAYRFVISPTSDLTYEPAYLLPFDETDAWRFNHAAALTVAMTSVLSLRLSHVLRYAAEPPPGFKTTDSIMAVSLVAKVRRPR